MITIICLENCGSIGLFLQLVNSLFGKVGVKLTSDIDKATKYVFILQEAGNFV